MQACAWADGAIQIERDYVLFGLLAGIRSSLPPAIPPRGLPMDLSSEVFEHYYEFIFDEHDAPLYRGFSWVSPQEAAVLLESGKSHAPPAEYKKLNTRSTLGYVSNPDWHSASWLWYDELLQVVPESVMMANPTLRVLSDTLRSIEHLFGRGRIVFWFDN